LRNSPIACGNFDTSVDDKQQTRGRALRSWSNRVVNHRRTASDVPKSPLDSASRQAAYS